MSEAKNQDTVETVAMQQVAAEPVADTRVLPQAASQPNTASEDTARMDSGQTDTVRLDTVQDAPTRTMPRPSAPRGDIPLDELARQRQQAADQEPRQAHPLGDNTVPMYTGAQVRPSQAAQPVEPLAIRTPAPTGVSAGTVVLGVLLVLLGVAAVAMAGMVPDWPFGAVDPWIVAAVGIGVVGVALVVIAIIWAVANAVSSRRRERE
ncbi:hypothetical protein [Bifidobacterium thermophilum]|uniref:hypothetical protein n=1 Tax=Bifidobacterium thermophilum TaxID=33905 RepID=UPI0030A0333A